MDDAPLRFPVVDPRRHAITGRRMSAVAIILLLSLKGPCRPLPVVPWSSTRRPEDTRMTEMTEAPERETLGFQAEVKQLLHLMIHSLYGNKEIFLRELVSNASDAADKLRFEALSDNALYGSDAELKIRVSFDRKARTIAVSDQIGRASGRERGE